MQKRPSQSIVPAQSGIFQDAVLRIKLIYRLLTDKRINPWLKLLPIGGILYLISPLDLIPDIVLPVIGQLDDLAILWLTNHFFIEFCPPEIVREHVRQLVSNDAIIEEERTKAAENDVVDGETTDITDQQ
jgi:uncharacterized membrane protein YkvA (DUF1232 family)